MDCHGAFGGSRGQEYNENCHCDRSEAIHFHSHSRPRESGEHGNARKNLKMDLPTPGGC